MHCFLRTFGHFDPNWPVADSEIPEASSRLQRKTLSAVPQPELSHSSDRCPLGRPARNSQYCLRTTCGTTRNRRGHRRENFAPSSSRCGTAYFGKMLDLRNTWDTLRDLIGTKTRQTATDEAARIMDVVASSYRLYLKIVLLLMVQCQCTFPPVFIATSPRPWTTAVFCRCDRINDPFERRSSSKYRASLVWRIFFVGVGRRPQLLILKTRRSTAADGREVRTLARRNALITPGEWNCLPTYLPIRATSIWMSSRLDLCTRKSALAVKRALRHGK